MGHDFYQVLIPFTNRADQNSMSKNFFHFLKRLNPVHEPG